MFRPKGIRQIQYDVDNFIIFLFASLLAGLNKILANSFEKEIRPVAIKDMKSHNDPMNFLRPDEDDEDSMISYESDDGKMSAIMEDEENSTDAASTASKGQGSTPSSSDREDEAILAGKETKLVNRSKCLVYIVLIVAAVGFATYTYFFMKEEQKVWYEDEVGKDWI